MKKIMLVLLALCCATQTTGSTENIVPKSHDSEYRERTGQIKKSCSSKYFNTPHKERIPAEHGIPTLHELAFNKLKPTLTNNVGKERYVEFAEVVAAHAPHLFPSFINGCTVDNERDTLLTRAAQNNQPKKIEQLLAIGVDVNQVNAWGASALREAVKKGSTTIPAMLLQAGANVNQEYLDLKSHLYEPDKGATPLFYASSKETVNLLLKNGANQHHTDHAGNNALHYAAKRNWKPHAIKALTKAGTSINSKNNKGETTFHMAMKSYVGNIKEIILACIEAGADETIQDNSGRTPRMLLSHTYSFNPLHEQEFDQAIEQRNQARLRDSTESQSTKKRRTK
ncbi:MAG: ankyrin repeat domain-containing protein [Candidatus Chromulinivorax sp.]|nr:ankyrin repeat domain-containing protein [Candidatus Chromulinivorax sp.]